jgi:hypothetical protein
MYRAINAVLTIQKTHDYELATPQGSEGDSIETMALTIKPYKQ